MINKSDGNWDERAEGSPLAAGAEKWGRSVLYKLASVLIRKEPVSGFSIGKIRSILIIKEPYRMGDLMQITPTLRALREKFPNLYIGLLIQDRNLPLFHNNPDVNEIFVYEKTKFNARPWMVIGFIRKIRRKRFDLAVTLETQRIHLTNDLLAGFSGAAYRLRYDGSSFGNEESNIFYNLLTPFNSSLAHEVDRNFGVFEPFGMSLENRNLKLHVTEKDLDDVRRILRTVLGSESRATCRNDEQVGENGLLKNMIVIHPGAYKINNRWPLENYLRVAEKIKESGKFVLFVLGPSELSWENEIRERKFPVVSGIPLMQLAGIFRLCRRVLCNDTGVMHISAAVGAKTVALFGETDPSIWKPPGDFVREILSPERKIDGIKMDTVLEIVKQTLLTP